MNKREARARALDLCASLLWAEVDNCTDFMIEAGIIDKDIPGVKKAMADIAHQLRERANRALSSLPSEPDGYAEYLEDHARSADVTAYCG